MTRLSKTRLRQGQQKPEPRPELEAPTPAERNLQYCEEEALMAAPPQTATDPDPS